MPERGTTAYVTWMTDSGFIAIPEDEANARRGAMQNQLGITDIITALGNLTSAVEMLTAHSENLIARMYDLEVLAGLHDPCPDPTCVDGMGYRIDTGTVPCQTCKGSGCNPTPKWSRT
jgi:hypothetical protein